MHPKNLSIKDFTYSLPQERIANYPLPERDFSKLLVYKAGRITGDLYKNIADHLSPGSLLVFNDTRVIEARLLFQKNSGAFIEIFCLAPHEQYPDIIIALSQQEKVLWQCLVGGASKWKHGQILQKKVDDLVITCRFIEKRVDCFIVELSWNKDLGFAEVLHKAGAIPLPPYIKRAVERSDEDRYQTVYAHTDGSVAAPTAGLHFTKNVFEKLKEKNIQTDFVTLHVGAGTFKPVKTETMETHEMHAEFIDVTKDSIENILRNLDKPIVAVGTTALRTIESLYWMGVRSRESGVGSHDLAEPGIISSESLMIDQWEAYELAKRNISVEQALTSLLGWMEKNNLKKLLTKTRIIIAPGYKTKIAKGLITNFHQPQSTLLLLVAALIGDDWRKVYNHAMKNNYRFLSYGDGSLLWIN